MHYDEIELEDLEYNEKEEYYYYPCPCGDNFVISKTDLMNGDDIGYCPSCSLTIRIIYDENDIMDFEDRVLELTSPTSISSSA